MLNISYNLLNTVLKVKNRVVIWVHVVASILVVYSPDHMVHWEQWLTATAPASLESILPYITTPGKDQNAKLQVWFSLDSCHTITKSKNIKSNHHKSKTISRNLINFRKLFLQNKNYSIQNNFWGIRKTKQKH